MPHPSGRPWIIAHRGASLVARENTIEAFRMAVDLGADAVELDVRRTADHRLIVHHDDTIAGADRPIVEMSRDDVAALDPEIPDLTDVLEACPDIWIDVEIKNDPREADYDPNHQVAQWIAHDLRDAPIVVTSFDPGTVATASAGGLRTGWLLGRGIDPADAAPEAAQAGHEFLLPHYSLLADHDGERIITAAEAAGVEVAVWTIDDPGEIRRLAALGVGGICSNAPDVARSALDDHRNGDSG